MLAAICKRCILVLQGFVADKILGGFNLNHEPTVKANAFPVHTAALGFFPSLQSVPSDNATNAAGDQGDETSSQPLVPYIRMVFDDLDVAKQVYVEYAFKLGFGIRIGKTKYSQARSAVIDTVLSRVFECVHAGK
jgi:hypothetical protein